MATHADHWSEGYVVDVEYIHNFLAGLAPLNLAAAAALAGVRPPDTDAAFAYLDLGCGNGFTPALLAAANPHAQFWGNDFNPAHVRNARATAQAAGAANAHFVEASFADLLEADLPAFDFVVAHGVWSWVGPAIRDQIVALLDRRLKPGGLALISYNCHPGWDALMPLRRLLAAPADPGTAPSERIERALATAQRLRASGAGYFRDNPAASAALDKLAGMNPAYIAHEYLNEHWTIFDPAEVAGAVLPAGLRYVGQARIMDNIDRFALTADQRALLDEQPRAAREAMRDVMLNRAFRSDLFVRDRPAAAAGDAAGWLADRRFVLAKPRAACSLSFTMPAGAFSLPAFPYDAVLDALGEGPATARALSESPALSTATPRQIGEALGVLAALSYIQPAHAEAGEAARRASTDRFNAAALDQARMGDALPALASPVTGSGVAVPAADQFVLDAHRFGIRFDAADDEGPAALFQREGIPALAMLGVV